MKRTILALATVAVFGGTVPGVETKAAAASWTVVTTTNQDTRFDRDRVKLNTATCATYSLPPSCTQTQARNAFCAVPGSSSQTAPCTLADGRSSNDVLIYGDIGTYLDKYVITSFFFPNLKQSQNLEDKNNFDKWLLTASQAQKDAVCVAAGLVAGCLP